MQTLKGAKAKAIAVKQEHVSKRCKNCRRIKALDPEQHEGHMKKTIALAAATSCAGFITVLQLPDVANPSPEEDSLALQQFANWVYYADGIATLDYDGGAFSPVILFASTTDQKQLCVKLAAAATALGLFCATRPKSIELTVFVEMAVVELGVPVLLAPTYTLFLRSPGPRFIHDGRTIQYPEVAANKQEDSIIFFPGMHVGGGFFSSFETPTADACRAWASDPNAFFRPFYLASKKKPLGPDFANPEEPTAAENKHNPLRDPWQINWAWPESPHSVSQLPRFEYRSGHHVTRYEANGDEFDESGELRGYRDRFEHHTEQMAQVVAYVFEAYGQGGKSEKARVAQMKKAVDPSQGGKVGSLVGSVQQLLINTTDYCLVTLSALGS
jgi:hypothetical protein